ncbi:MAG: tyrosine-type recombinase/integrase [Nitrososphaera sp.]|nr:tyrosine-type recombinase/integrase [Nitrososphaera sp.]
MLRDVEKYIELHKSLGFKFKQQSYQLRNFARFAFFRRERVVKTKSVLEWASQAPSPVSRTERLRFVRRFAIRMSAENSKYEIPPMLKFGPGKRRRPHIFTDDEISRLLAATSKLHPSSHMTPLTLFTLFGLIVSTGLRVSEALALKVEDVTVSGLVIRNTKFRKSRLVPLHPTVRDALDRYLARRKKIPSVAKNVFVTLRGRPLAYPTVISQYLILARKSGLRQKAGCPGPRIHDLRHTFAVRSLEQCPKDRESIQRHIHALSTYLGHAHTWDTFWYLQATPKLMNGIARDAELLASGGGK